MSNRLIVVSNRVPLDGPGSGGLVVALHEALLAEEEGVWVGSADADGDPPSTFEEHDDGSPYTKLTFGLTEEDQQNYYLGYANSVLWPLCHRRSDLIAYESGFHEAYRRVNERLATMLAEIVRPDDRLWIHDYHFFPLGCFLRDRGVTNRIGFFLHIPFPHPSELPALPDRDVFADWIAGYDLVGLQTERDVATCLEMFRVEDAAELLSQGRVRHNGRTVTLKAFPIGIDVDVMRRAAEKPEAPARLKLDPRERLLIGVDRLDYSKGIVNRVEAFGAYLDARGAKEPRATLLQIAPPTRENVQAYVEIRDQLEGLTGKINGRHSEIDWTPIRYIHRMIPREQLAALFRRADAGLVTPLADGMNLVAKEYVACQDPENPGVLILSRFAGAAEQLESALMVNPYDNDDMAQAIDRALEMELWERKERYETMYRQIETYDIEWWRTEFLAALGSTAQSVPATA
jgi:trehalose 6-phosphate synthase